MKLNFFSSLFKNPKGFSLTEVMIGGAILAGVGLTAATLFKQQNSAQSLINNDQALEQFHRSVAKVLENVHHCNATLGELFYTRTFNDGDQLPGIKLCTSQCELESDAGDVVGGDYYQLGDWIDKQQSRQLWLIKDIRLVKPTNETGPQKIIFLYDQNPKKGNRTVQKEVNVGLRFASDGTFRECVNNQESAVNNLQKDICKSLGGESGPGVIARWDEDTQSCLMANDLPLCPSGQLVEGIKSDGSVVCKAVSTVLTSSNFVGSPGSNCPAGSKTSLVIDSAGKLRVSCTP
jgi:hypothetical protein